MNRETPPVAILDTETTGLNSPEIIEIAWVELVGSPFAFDVGSSSEDRFRPSKEIELGALATHHILDTELAWCAPSSEAALPFESGYIIGHNVDYDMQFFDSPEYRKICTLALSRWLWPELSTHTQTAMIYHVAGRTVVVRERLRDAHSALTDVRNCAVLLRAIVEKAQPETWEDLYQMSEKARIPTHMTFGKHKGTRISELPASYVDWFLRQDNIDKYLAIALRGRA